MSIHNQQLKEQLTINLVISLPLKRVTVAERLHLEWVAVDERLC